MMLLITCVDQLEDEDVTVDEWLENAPRCIQEIAYKSAGGYFGLNNKLRGKENEVQISQLFSKIHTMVRENGGDCYSSLVYTELQALLSAAAGASDDDLLGVLQGIEENLESQCGVVYDILKLLMRLQTFFEFEDAHSTIRAMMKY